MSPRRQILSALFLGAMTLCLSGCNSDSTSPDNNLDDLAPPQAPTNAHAQSDAATRRDWLAWDPSPSPNVTGYLVYYSDTPSGVGDLVVTVDVGSTVYLLPVVTESAVEYYRVRAIKASGTPSQFTPAVEVQRSVWSNRHGDTDEQDPTRE